MGNPDTGAGSRKRLEKQNRYRPMTTDTEDRKNRGLVLWLTGLSSSGKTTLSLELEREMKLRGCRVEILDGDLVRKSLSKGLGFSREDRDTNIRRIGFVANLLSRNGVVVIVAAISPYRAAREEVRRMVENTFVEIYLNAPLEICEARDPKGLYAMARAGELRAFTGVDDPYEEPLNPEIVCYTAEEKIAQSVSKIMAHLEEMEYVPVKLQLEYFI
jgi:adenylylsulfate kinase